MDFWQDFTAGSSSWVEGVGQWLDLCGMLAFSRSEMAVYIRFYFITNDYMHYR